MQAQAHALERLGGGDGNYRNIFFREGRYTAKSITDYQELLRAYRLRHEVFSEGLGWTPKRSNRLEHDAYDVEAMHFGVFEGESLLAYLRLILPGRRFMVEKEFLNLVGPGHAIRKKADTCEMSRLCLSERALGLMRSENFGHDSIQMVLHKCVYHWCNRNAVRYLYLVVEKKVYRMMRICGFVCRPVGDAVRMPDGVEAVAAVLDLREFDAVNRTKKPTMYQWFTQYQSGPSALPGQLPGSGLQH